LSHMEGVKLRARSEEELRNEIRIVKAISNYMKMEFGLENLCQNFFKR